MERLKTDCLPLDNLLGGGLEKGIITTVFGPAGSGKSNIAIICASSASKLGTVVFVDTESSFSLERYSQISGLQKLKNIELVEPAEFEDQKKAIRELREIVEKKDVVLIIIDSLTMLYRLELSQNPDEINFELTKQLSILSSIARKKNIPILVTNQVYSDFENPGNVKMVGGDILKYWSKCILRLEKEGSVRKLFLAKHRSLPENIGFVFKIISSGLEEEREIKESKKFSLF